MIAETAKHVGTGTEQVLVTNENPGADDGPDRHAMSGALENPTQPVITSQQDAAQAILSYFLANADAGNNAANDALIAELARHQRHLRQQQTR